MPSIPSLNGENSSVGMETICADCGKTISRTSTVCDNPSCSRRSGKKITRPKNKPDEKGKNPRLQQHEVVYQGMPVNKMSIPGVPIAAQITNTMIKPQVKPIKNKTRMISDDDAEIVDERHLSNVEQTANHLGL